MALTCRACGADNPAGKKFCVDCGTARDNRCPQCGAENPAGKKFCGDCGAPVGAQGSSRAADATAEGSAGASPSQRAPAPYTPKHLAEKILQSRSALEGERKQVTVLFADVKGSMELAEQLDPDDAGKG